MAVSPLQALIPAVVVASARQDTPQERAQEAVVFAYPPLVHDQDDVARWRIGLAGVDKEHEAVVVSELITRGVVTSPQDLAKYSFLWEPGFDFSQTVPNAELFLSPEEEALYLQMRERFSSAPPCAKDAEMFLDSNDLSLSRVLTTLSIDFPELENIILEQLEVRMALGENVLSSIPNRSVLERLLRRPQGERLRQMLRENWETLGSDLGHIIYGEDKADYDNLLGSNLTREGMDSFSAPFMVVDLNNMERRTYAAAVRVIDENRVLYTVNVGGVLKAGVVNPKDTSTSKFFLRQAFPQDDQYLLCYFPKVSLTDEGWQVQAKYEKRDRYYENLLGKDDFENNLTPAVDNFMRAFAKEDQFKQESYAAFQKLVTPDLLQKLRSEPALDVQGILDLMLVMADSRCREEAPAIFGISSAEYASYEEKILQFLEEAKNLSREEFLVEAIKICDGRAALAAVIAYNTLLPLGEIGNNALFTRYPRAFRMLEDMQDQAGSIYHYYGTFFAAYSLQRWLVDRYHQDGKFASTIDKWGTRLQKGNGTANLDTATLSEYYDLLLIAQFQYLSVGGSDAKEIMSLAGIFFEEVYEDRELSKETHEDIRGMSAGHAFYELVSGNKLVEEASWRKVFVNMAKNFMTSDLEWWQKLLLRFMAQ